MVAAILLSALGGCQKVEAWQKPELAACESFIRSSLKSPASYKRADYTVIDEAVSRQLLGKAVGLSGNAALDKDVQDGFVKPTIRSVLVNYDADNAFGASLRAAASCRFAMSDNRYVIKSPQNAADAATSENQMRQLSALTDGKVAVSTDCCLSENFNLDDLNAEGRKGGFSVSDQGKS